MYFYPHLYHLLVAFVNSFNLNERSQEISPTVYLELEGVSFSWPVDIGRSVELARGDYHVSGVQYHTAVCSAVLCSKCSTVLCSVQCSVVQCAVQCVQCAVQCCAVCAVQCCEVCSAVLWYAGVLPAVQPRGWVSGRGPWLVIYSNGSQHTASYSAGHTATNMKVPARKMACWCIGGS